MEYLNEQLTDATTRQAWVRSTLRLQFDIVRRLAGVYRHASVVSLFPPAYENCLQNCCMSRVTLAGQAYVDAMVDGLISHGRDLAAVRAAARLVRNLSVAEIVVAGDLGDRGPRIDRVIEYLTHQPNVSIAWGNHDVFMDGRVFGPRGANSNRGAHLASLPAAFAARRGLWPDHVAARRNLRARFMLKIRPKGLKHAERA